MIGVWRVVCEYPVQCAVLFLQVGPSVRASREIGRVSAGTSCEGDNPVCVEAVLLQQGRLWPMSHHVLVACIFNVCT